MDLKEELKKINNELESLRGEKAQLQRLRKAKMEALKGKINVVAQKVVNAPTRFAAEHPVIAAVGEETAKQTLNLPGYAKETAEYVGEKTLPTLKKVGRWLYNNQMRANSNKAFSLTLKIGQSAVNPQTGQTITRTENDYIASWPYGAKNKKLVKV